MPVREVAALLEDLSGTVPGRALLELADVGPGLWLVGGAVRDGLLGRRPRELDILVEGDAAALAATLANILGGRVITHASFGTASILTAHARIDLASAREESYSAPGALPDVRPGTLEEDLHRRDFSINTLALALAPAHRGQLRGVADALEDLRAGRLRVLHDLSFIDDPTRLLRMARYAARLVFYPDEHTLLLASRAVDSGALATVSGARIGAELRLALNESDPLATLSELARLGVLRALHPRLRVERELARDALELLGDAGRADLLLLAALVLALTLSVSDEPERELHSWLDRLEFPAADRDLVLRTALRAPRLLDELASAREPSQIRAVVAGSPVEAVALAGALGAREPAYRWLSQLRHVRLQITGTDLLAAGVPAGPEVGRRLDVALDRRLDGLLFGGAEAELHAALDDR